MIVGVDEAIGFHLTAWNRMVRPRRDEYPPSFEPCLLVGVGIDGGVQFPIPRPQDGRCSGSESSILLHRCVGPHSCYVSIASDRDGYGSKPPSSLSNERDGIYVCQGNHHVTKEYVRHELKGRKKGRRRKLERTTTLSIDPRGTFRVSSILRRKRRAMGRNEKRTAFIARFAMPKSPLMVLLIVAKACFSRPTGENTIRFDGFDALNPLTALLFWKGTGNHPRATHQVVLPATL